jgi:hypothetical protein
MTNQFIEAIAMRVVELLTPLLSERATPQRLLTMKQAAVYLGRTEGSMRQLINRGAFAHVKSDGRVMLDIKDLDNWILEGKTRRDY